MGHWLLDDGLLLALVGLEANLLVIGLATMGLLAAGRVNARSESGADLIARERLREAIRGVWLAIRLFLFSLAVHFVLVLCGRLVSDWPSPADAVGECLSILGLIAFGLGVLAMVMSGRALVDEDD
jgi:hypothetical protein